MMKYLYVGLVLLCASSAAVAGDRVGPDDGETSVLHSVQYQEGIQGLEDRPSDDLKGLAAFEVEDMTTSEVWWVWNPVSGSLTSGCWVSGCGLSGCGGSGCIFSGCGVSGCGGSGCAASDCEASLCGGSDCEGSVCLGSDCEGSVCIGSDCQGTVCQGSGCAGSVCAGSNCDNSMCQNSGCDTNNCDNPPPQGFHSPLDRSRYIVSAELDDDVLRFAAISNGTYMLRYIDASGSVCEALVVAQKGRVAESPVVNAAKIVSITQATG